ncbi:MAG: saccharopine dehydrogenase NADP-binding domain-containing protein [Bacteroidetes bacterium]|nr:saccharopine dehydrogenase NADP-binding domain-containing protein [Bacteroidota bacterium]
MKHIILLGAGRSSSVLLEYLKEQASSLSWKISVADISLQHAKDIVKENSSFSFHDLNKNPGVKEDLIQQADVVISMLPASFHVEIARLCLKHKKHLVTASYVSPEMKAMEEEVKNAGLIFMNEAGLDPGLDHISAMKIIDHLRAEGAILHGFESFCGGLIAPESDDNPWHYKFTWNPRNVVVAGQGGAAMFLQEGTFKYIPYHKLFRRTEVIDIEGYGKFEGYANRDSLKYIDIYGLQGIKTIFRGTLRRLGFCRAWDLFVQLGMTDDTYRIADSDKMTHRQFINLFLAYNKHDSVELKLKHYMKLEQDDVDIWEKLEYTGIFSHEKIGLKNATPAQILQHILEKKWKLNHNDKDMIIMFHRFNYKLNNEAKELHSYLVVEGEDENKTAMAKTVGLPVGIVAKMILNGDIKSRGVLVPVEAEVYNPILDELKKYGIHFVEKQAI